MVGMSSKFYSACFPPEGLERRLGRFLVSKVRVRCEFEDVAVVGFLGTGRSTAELIAKRFNAPLFLLPIEILRLSDEPRTIVGAVSGVDDSFAFDEELLRSLGISQDLRSSAIYSARVQLLLASKSEPRCRAWFEERECIAGKSVLLVDSAFISPQKLGLVLECLSRCSARSITLAGFFLSRTSVLGARFPMGAALCLREEPDAEAVRVSVARYEGFSSRKLELEFGESTSPLLPYS